MIIVKIKTPPFGAGNAGKFHLKSETNFTKREKVPSSAIRTLYSFYGSLEGLVRLLSTKECEGTLVLSIRNGAVECYADLYTYTESVLDSVTAITAEMYSISDCIVRSYSKYTVSLDIVFKQTIEY